MYPFQMLAIRLNWPIAARLPWYWQRLACYLSGVNVTVQVAPGPAPLLIAANHISWLDISVLGSVLPVSFVAKLEVARWPVVGTLARLQRSVFIDRTRRSQAGEAASAIASRVGRGDIIVLFAEGTTGDGNRVLPFRSALLGAARAAAGAGGTTAIQPVAISYVAIQGLPVGFSDRPNIAWYGGMKLARHFMRLIGYGALDVVVSFGEPIAFGPNDDRKRVATMCFDDVRRMIDNVRRNPPPSMERRRQPLFSGSEKGTKGAAKALPGDRPEEIVSRIS
jgi:1-acyl-sn-glycerol-3-phosphate acyltransferase